MPKATHLTLTRVCKALVESEEGERREKTKKRKRKRAGIIEDPRDPAL